MRPFSIQNYCEKSSNYGSSASGKSSIISCLTGENLRVDEGTRDTTKEVMCYTLGASAFVEEGDIRRTERQETILRDTPGFGANAQESYGYFNRLLGSDQRGPSEDVRDKNFDIAVCVLECGKWQEYDDLHRVIVQADKPVLLVSNKYDFIMSRKEARESWESHLHSKFGQYKNVQMCYFIGLMDSDPRVDRGNLINKNLSRSIELKEGMRARDELNIVFKQRLLSMISRERTRQYRSMCEKFVKVFLDERMRYIEQRWRTVGWSDVSGADYSELAKHSADRNFGLANIKTSYFQTSSIRCVDMAETTGKVVGAIGGVGIGAIAELVTTGTIAAPTVLTTTGVATIMTPPVALGIVGCVALGALAYFGSAEIKHLYNRFRNTGMDEILSKRVEAEQILLSILLLRAPLELQEFDSFPMKASAKSVGMEETGHMNSNVIPEFSEKLLRKIKRKRPEEFKKIIEMQCEKGYIGKQCEKYLLKIKNQLIEDITCLSNPDVRTKEAFKDKIKKSFGIKKDCVIPNIDDLQQYIEYCYGVSFESLVGIIIDRTEEIKCTWLADQLAVAASAPTLAPAPVPATTNSKVI